MTLLANPEQVCMWFEVIRKHVARSHEVINKGVRSLRRIIRVRSKLTRTIAELLFENCIECQKMAAIPQGAFAARKVRQNRERYFLISKIEGDNNSSDSKANVYEGRELTPLKYNSKLMNSIWGLYNRYSVHNFKKNMDASYGAQAATWGAFFYNASQATTTATVAATAAAKTSQILESESSLSSAYH